MIDRNFILNVCQKSSDMNEYLMSIYNIPVQIYAHNIVEIGSGVSTFALVAAANKIGGSVTSIDIGGWDTLNRIETGDRIMRDEPNFTMVEGSSLEVPLIENIDFFLLDSEHTYDLTMNEMNRWFGSVRKRGIIFMHDTAHESGQAMQCRQALNDYLKIHRDEYIDIHLLDTKIIGASILVKI